MREREIWKEYALDRFKFDSFFKIEVSNFGNMRTYNMYSPDGASVGGSQQGGYLCLRSKLHKAKSKKDLERLDAIKKELDLVRQKIKETAGPEKEEKLDVLRAERDKLIEKRKKLNHKIGNKNTINLCILFHKAVAELFLDAPKNKDYKFVIHKDFDKLNNHYKNLEWATQEMVNERVKKHPKMILHEFKKQFNNDGPQVKSSKLSEMDVLTIKKRLKRGYTLNKLAKQFGVSDMQIHRIKSGENWSHVKLIEEILEEKRK